MRKVLLIGCGGAGKSTLGLRVAARLGLPLVHLDALYWKPGWVEPSKPEWAQVVAELSQGDAWVMDGNYGGTLDLRFAACDAVIFLDLPRVVCLWRVLKRRVQFHRKTRPDMGPGCPESLDWPFMLWVWNYRRDKRPAILRKLADLAASGKQVFVLSSSAAVETFLAQLPPAAE